MPDATTLAAPGSHSGISAKWGGQGNLWFPHVYMPNQNPADHDGANADGPMGLRSLVLAAVTACHWPIATPNPSWTAMPPDAQSIVPEAFMDTPVVNGTAYPYLTVAAQGLPVPDPECLQRPLPEPAAVLRRPAIRPDGESARKSKWFPRSRTRASRLTWPTDGRDGGVPDPATAGPAMIQIGTEGGFLPAPVVLPNHAGRL